MQPSAEFETTVDHGVVRSLLFVQIFELFERRVPRNDKPKCYENCARFAGRLIRLSRRSLSSRNGKLDSAAIYGHLSCISFCCDHRWNLSCAEGAGTFGENILHVLQTSLFHAVLYRCGRCRTHNLRIETIRGIKNRRSDLELKRVRQNIINSMVRGMDRRLWQSKKDSIGR